MDLSVTFQPNKELEQWFGLESGISIKRQRNKPSTVSIILDNNFTTRNIDGYGTVRVDLDDMNLFDGKTQGRSFAKDKIVFNGNDWLWDFGRKKRSFFQSTDMRPDESFTEAFDNATDFGNFTGYWDTYSNAWITGFDAKTFVVPSESQQFSEFFDGENKSGLEFMQFNADAAFRGNSFKYYYWYQYINGTKYLFFQPNKWGKVWDNLVFTAKSLKETYQDIWNDIVVWGRGITGYYPTDQDKWTENDINSLAVLSGTISLSSLRKTLGQYSLRIDVTGTSNLMHKLFSIGSDPYINLETMNTFNIDIWADTGNTNSETRVHLGYAPVGTWVTSWEPITANTWNNLSFTKDDFSVFAGSPDWKQIQLLQIQSQTNGGVFSDYWYYDRIYFHIYPIKSQNTSSITGYDSASEDDYGYRELSIKNHWIKTVADCNSFASNLLNYYKSPQYQSNITIPNFVPINLNDQIYGNFYGNLLTLPVDSIIWNFKEDSWETKIGLGVQRMSADDLLNKLFEDVGIESYDRGMEYYVF